MRIAFASCIATNVFSDQPVWDWIGAHAPDHLVLLGDSMYLDILVEQAVHPKDMSENDFAKHAHHILESPPVLGAAGSYQSQSGQCTARGGAPLVLP